MPSKSLKKFKKAVKFYTECPELDYFYFADTFDKDSQSIDIAYLATLQKLIKFGSRSCKNKARIAKTLFKDRYIESSYFYRIYYSYWNTRNHIELSNNLQRQAREATVHMARMSWEKINLETRMALNLPATAIGPTTITDQTSPANHATTTDHATPTEHATVIDPSTAIIEDFKFEINKFYQDRNDLFDTVLNNNKIIDLSNDEESLLLKNKISKGTYEEIIKMSSIPSSTLSSICTSFLETFSKCPTSLIQFRSCLMSSKEFEKITYDPYEHNDWDIVHSMAFHFLRMIESPVNPISSKTLERTHATWTTYPLINSLFLQYSNIIKIKWSEVTHEDMDTTKLDGLGIGSQDDGLVMVLELAGGFACSGGQTKLDEDTMKLYSNVLVSLNLRKSLDKIFTVLYHNNILYLESLTKYGDNYIRKRHSTIAYPTDVIGLKRFICRDLPKALIWKNAVLDHQLKKNGID